MAASTSRHTSTERCVWGLGISHVQGLLAGNKTAVTHRDKGSREARVCSLNMHMYALLLLYVTKQNVLKQQKCVFGCG